MARPSNQHDQRPAVEPLDAAFDERDREIDSLLGDLLRDQPAPRGLCDRIYAATVSLLPHPAAAGDRPKLRYVPAPSSPARLRLAVRRRVISRVAMAASVALACAIGIKVCLPGAMNASIASAHSVADDSDWSVFGSTSNGLSDVSYLLETDRMTLDDVTGEMARLARLSDAGM